MIFIIVDTLYVRKSIYVFKVIYLAARSLFNILTNSMCIIILFLGICLSTPSICIISNLVNYYEIEMYSNLPTLDSTSLVVLS